MYAPVPKNEGNGFDLGNFFKSAVIEVWPENWPSFQLFAKLDTQWNVGGNGLVGLRYEVIYPLLDRVSKDDDEWESLFSDIRHMERIALNTVR